MHPHLDFRSYDETNMEVMYFHMFPAEQDFPNVIGTEYFSPEIVDFFKKHKLFSFICEDVFTGSVAKGEATQMIEEGNLQNYIDARMNGGNDSHAIFFKRKNPTQPPFLIKLRKSDGNYIIFIASKDMLAINKLIQEIKKKFLHENDYDKQTYFGVLYKDNYGVKVKQYPLNDDYISTLDIGLNYGTDFVKINDLIISKLKKYNSSLMLISGIKGVGKSSYIKYLSHQIGKDFPFIFIPTSYIDELISPNLLPLLLKHKNSILVLEDAEKAIVSREEQTGNESLVSTLLNLGDGILGSMLQIKIIITFNTSSVNVDSALRRKQRLSYEHEFKPLSIVDSQKLIDNLKKQYTVTEPMSLADIYGLEDNIGSIQNPKKIIGFQTV